MTEMKKIEEIKYYHTWAEVRVNMDIYTHLKCWLCDLNMQCGSHICSLIYAYMELMLNTEFILYIGLYIDNYYTHL